MRIVITVMITLLLISSCREEEIDPNKFTLPGILVASRTGNGILLDWNFNYIAFGSQDMNLSNIYIPGAVPAERIEIFHSLDDTLHFSRIADVVPGGQFLYEVRDSGHDHYFRLRTSAKGARSGITRPIHVQFRENPEIIPLIRLPYDYLLQMGNFSQDGSRFLYSRKYRWDPENNCCEDYSAMAYHIYQFQETLLFPQAYYPVWSPDGDRIAFHAVFSENDIPDKNQIGLFDPETDTIFQLTTGSQHFELPVWHPNGQSLIYLSFNENTNFYDVFSMDLISGDYGLLSNNSELQVNYERLSFSPDGNMLAYSSYGDEYSQNLYVLNLGTNNISPLLASIWTDRHPSFSPDGRYLAFLSYRTGRDEIWIMDLATEALHQLTGDINDYLYGDLVWSPDSEYLYFKIYRDDQFGIYYARVDL